MLYGDWERLSATLDDDMRLIYPKLYIDHQYLFDQIVDIGYLLTHLDDPEKRLDWVSSSSLKSLLKRDPNVAILSKMLIVRLRLPWNEVDTEFLVSQQELDEHLDEYEVLESYIFAKSKGSDDPPAWMLGDKRLEFEENRDNYEVIEKRYSVRWIWANEEIEKLLDESLVNKDRVHEYMAQ